MTAYERCVVFFVLFGFVLSVSLVISLLGFGISAINHFLLFSLSWFCFFLCALLNHLNVTGNHYISV